MWHIADGCGRRDLAMSDGVANGIQGGGMVIDGEDAITGERDRSETPKGCGFQAM